MVRGIPRDACDEEKLSDYFRSVDIQKNALNVFLNISREAYPKFQITHLTLAYNIASLQHVYKRRLVISFKRENCDHFLLGFSELNLRIWQQSKNMLEKSGKRPVVYNNKCGQLCGVSIRTRFNFDVFEFRFFFLVLRRRGQ